MAIRWTRALSVGLADIDAQHKELFRRARAFADGLQGRSRQDVGILLSYLRAYAVTHFDEEEEAMRAALYPGLKRHKAEHDRFMRDILRMTKDQEKRRGPGVDPRALARWLEDWLVEHVSSIDKTMARFFLARAEVGPRERR
ncbi:MAG TPA: hemerythrin family protein [Anaeromyxobacteraceae bacterium]|nr:hemerythrin family protein [Anaeromyxobacteraceae bacterium]